MKQFGFILLSIVLLGFAGSAMAKPPKNDIMHCGCIYVADSETTGVASMVWTPLSVKNGNGHRNHVEFHQDDCLSGFDEVFCTEDDVVNEVPGCESTESVKGYDPQYTTFERNADDCLVDGNLNFLESCDDPETHEDETPVVGTECGSELLD